MADDPCPCKKKLSDGEKNAVTVGLSDFANILQNPNAAALGALDNLVRSNGTGLGTLIQTATNSGTESAFYKALPALQSAKTQFDAIKLTQAAFAAECNKLTDPKNLLRIVSSLGLYAELNCALGIPGLDIGAGIGVVNQNGQLSIQVALNAQIKLDSILKEFGDGTAGDALQKLQDGMNGVSEAMSQANAAIDNVVKETQAAQKAATELIQKYTSINGLFNLVNLGNEDSCFKLGTAVNASLISPQFYQAVSAAAVPTGGTSTR